MLRDHDSAAIVAVSDIARARAFYTDTLGLEAISDTDDMLVYKTGHTFLTVYRSEFAGTNRANAVVWGVGDDLDAIVAALEAKFTMFEHYPEIGRLDGNIHVASAPGSDKEARLVWIKDPDGNILHFNNM